MPEEKKIICPICLTFYGRRLATDNLAGKIINFFECPNCQTIYTDLTPDKDNLISFYQDQFVTDTYYLSPNKISRINQQIINLVKKSAAPGSITHQNYSFYEIGFGAGLLLAALERLGLRPGGCELNKTPVKNSQITTNGGFFEGFKYQNIFDCVYANHVLEHSARPAELMAAIEAALKPGGAAIIKVPSKNSLTQKIAGRFLKDKSLSQCQLEIPEHLYCFTPEGLKELCRRSGLIIKSCDIRSDLFYENYFLQILVIMARGLLSRLPWADKINRTIDRIKMARSKSPAYRLLKIMSRITTWANSLLTKITGKFWPALGEEIVLVAKKPLEKIG